MLLGFKSSTTIINNYKAFFSIIPSFISITIIIIIIIIDINNWYNGYNERSVYPQLVVIIL